MNRRGREVAERVAERRRREDEAPLLKSLVPTLEELNLQIEERRAGARLAESSYIRRIVVEHARALFLIPCGDRTCRDGGHDLTSDILSALGTGARTFEGENACLGQTGSAACQRVLRYVAEAEFSGSATHKRP
jgi:hypothetical protein